MTSAAYSSLLRSRLFFSYKHCVVTWDYNEVYGLHCLYTQFTSPLRKYIDITQQKLIAFNKYIAYSFVELAQSDSYERYCFEVFSNMHSTCCCVEKTLNFVILELNYCGQWTICLGITSNAKPFATETSNKRLATH